MIQFTGYDLLWLFFIYSFVGWVLETAAATFMHRKFSNRGLVNARYVSCTVWELLQCLWACRS